MKEHNLRGPDWPLPASPNLKGTKKLIQNFSNHTTQNHWQNDYEMDVAKIAILNQSDSTGALGMGIGAEKKKYTAQLLDVFDHTMQQTSLEEASSPQNPDSPSLH